MYTQHYISLHVPAEQERKTLIILPQLDVVCLYLHGLIFILRTYP